MARPTENSLEGEIEDFGQVLDRFVVDRLMATR